MDDRRLKKLEHLIRSEVEEIIREVDAQRPRSRADCATGERPCMFISARVMVRALSLSIPFSSAAG